jgi:hypothetical protein
MCSQIGVKIAGTAVQEVQSGTHDTVIRMTQRLSLDQA